MWWEIRIHLSTPYPHNCSKVTRQQAVGWMKMIEIKVTAKSVCPVVKEWNVVVWFANPSRWHAWEENISHT